jgi:hypothetical protein
LINRRCTFLICFATNLMDKTYMHERVRTLWPHSSRDWSGCHRCNTHTAHRTRNYNKFCSDPLLLEAFAPKWFEAIDGKYTNYHILIWTHARGFKVFLNTRVKRTSSS